MLRAATLILTFIFLPAVGLSKTITVPGDYPHIQLAIDAASNGDTVLVSPGTYADNINFKGKAILVKSCDGPEVTIIDGGQLGSVVAFTAKEGPGSVLDGFSITNGNETYGGGIQCFGSSPTILNDMITDNTGYMGGGIYCTEGAPTISHCMILNNLADTGGGIYCLEASPIIQHGMIRENHALSGGGVYCHECSPEIFGNVITRNTCSYNGGGIFAAFSSLSIENNEISENSGDSGGAIHCRSSSKAVLFNNKMHDNHVDWAGGAIFCHGSNTLLTMTNCTLYGNTSEYGGGIHLRAYACADILNCSFFGNSALIRGGGIECCGSYKVTITNSILWNDKAPTDPEICYSGFTPEVNHCDVEGGSPGTGNIDSDPLFMDAGGADFHLTFPSPCRNKGLNSAPGIPDVDFDGNPRIAHGAADMGADEFYTHLYYTGNATPAGQVALKFTDLPGTSPTVLWLGSGVLDKPIHTKYGDWYLKFPILFEADLGAIPSPEGVLVLSVQIPPTVPIPLSLPLQAGLGEVLTDCCVLEIE